MIETEGDSNKSPFAQALQELLDATGLFSRREWAKLLSIKEATISQWVNEEAIPSANYLNMVFITVDKASDAKKGPLDAFLHMARLPATEASPKNGRRMFPTVWDYMKRPL